MPFDEQFRGDRYGLARVPSGHECLINNDPEKLTPDRIAERPGDAFRE
jgi:hypothetical protein